MHWSRIPEATFAPGIRVLLALYSVFGRRAFRAALWPVVLWYALARPAARRASAEYLGRLRQASDGTTPAPTFAGTLRHFAAFAEALLDKLLVWGGRLEALRYELHGAAALREALAAGRGAVLVTAHIGNFELCQVLATRYTPVRINVLMHTANTARFNALLERQRLAERLCLIPVDGLGPATAALLAQRVDAGELVAIAGDRLLADGAGGSLATPFLGQPAAFPIGPYVLAAALGCPLIALFATRHGEMYRISVEQLAERVILPRQGRPEALRALLERFVALLEAECRAAPLQWFNFYPFWAPPDAG
jgi:predicted LPLAT superfamily acyltransferase